MIPLNPWNGCREDLVQYRTARDQFCDAARRRLLVGEQPEFLPRIRGGDRGPGQFGEVG